MSPNFPVRPLIPAKQKDPRVPLVFLNPSSLPAGNWSQDKPAAPLEPSCDHLPETGDPGDFTHPAKEAQTQH